MAAFSVLLSIYGKENPLYFQEALQSIVEQSRVPDEFVIVEDGPLTDELEKVLYNFKQRYKAKTKVISLPVNKGLGIALQRGVLECNCPYIARMDTDDIANPNRFQIQMEYLEKKPNIALLGSWIREFSSDIEHPDTLTQLPCSFQEILLYSKKRNPFRHMTVIFRKDAVLEAGNYRDFLWFEDYDLWVRLLQQGFKMENLPQYLVDVRADKDMFSRRGGIKYLKQDIKFQNFLYNSKFISFPEFAENLAIRGIVRILPNSLRKVIYKNLLRKPVN